MNFYTKFFVLVSALSMIKSHTHDEIFNCILKGVYKGRQTLIESPNYPNNYVSDNNCWDYVIRSPYKCPTTFHVQFLNFYLEYSKGCTNAYLAVGLENIEDDMDVLCGQVVGIKKYHTPDGVLRLRFFTSASSWSTGKGFKLLVTRLACESELQANHGDYDNNETDEDTSAVSAPSASLQPPEQQLTQAFRNLTGQERPQFITAPPLYGLNYPTQLPSPPYPATGTVYVPVSQLQGPFAHYAGSSVQNNLQQPCVNALPNVFNYYGDFNGKPVALDPYNLGGVNQANHVLSYWRPNVYSQQPAFEASVNKGFLTYPRNPYIRARSSAPSLLKLVDSSIESLEACCVSAFQQKHFYLSSPGFPRNTFNNIGPTAQRRDCVFYVQKSAPNICRLRLDFKFFNFGGHFQATASAEDHINFSATQNTQDVCQEDFLEIDNQRFCGCHSGLTFTAYWISAANKKLRMRMGYTGIPSQGFLLELIQEECSEAQLSFMTTERPLTISSTPTVKGLFPNNPFVKPQQTLYEDSSAIQQQTHHTSSRHYPGQDSVLQNPLEHQALPHATGIAAINSQPQSNFLPQHHNLYPTSFASNYFSYTPLHNFQQQQQQRGLPQTRYARSFADQQQPLTVVETNSTRKEYYYSANGLLNYNKDVPSTTRSNSSRKSSSWDRKDPGRNDRNLSVDNVGRQRGKCSFEMADMLRLSVDILWTTKPICYAPPTNWLESK